MSRRPSRAARPGWLRRSMACCVVAAGLSVAAAGPALAHDRLEQSTPQAGAELSRPPGSVTLRYSNPVLGLGAAVQVSGPDGVISAGGPQVDGRTVTQRLAPDAPSGRYLVQWRVSSADGHPISGEFRFAVAGPATEPATTEPVPTEPAPTAAPPVAAPAGTVEHSGHEQQQGLINRLAGSGWLLVGGGLGVTGLGLVGLLRSRRRARDGTEPQAAPTATV